MSTGLFFRSFCGFALQLVPCVILMLLPFRKECFPLGKRKTLVLLTAVSIILSLVYPLNIRINMRMEKNGNLDDNLYMLLSIIVILYAKLITGQAVINR